MWRDIWFRAERFHTGFFPTAKRLTLITLGAILMAFNINIFVHTANLFPGGLSGVTLLAQNASQKYFSISLPYSPIVLALNIVPVWIGFKFIGKRFTLYSLYMLVLSSLLVDFIPYWTITNDMLLCAIFGGLVSALSTYLCLLAGATSGGTDFIAIFISEKYSVDSWNYIFSFNAIMLVFAGLVSGWNEALYSILFQFTSTQFLNSVYKRYQKSTLWIITAKQAEVYNAIRAMTNHDATLFKGRGCYQGSERDLLYSVISYDEVRKVVKRIKQIDEQAFINVIRSHQIVGRFYRPPND